MFSFFSRSRKNEEENRQQAEQLILQEKRHKELKEVQETIANSFVLRRCSEIIEAYCQIEEKETFKICTGGPICVIVPKPQDKYSDAPIEVTFEDYYDDWHLRSLMDGKSYFEATTDLEGTKVYHGVPQELTNYGLSPILVGKDITLTLDEQRVKWSIKIDATFGVYGVYNYVSFDERFQIFKEMLENRYPNLRRLTIRKI